MTARGRRLLLLAAGLYLVSWGFGTPVMFPVAVGLSLAPLAAFLWVRVIDRPMLLRRRTGHLELLLRRKRCAGTLFAVAQRRVEDSHVI